MLISFLHITSQVLDSLKFLKKYLLASLFCLLFILIYSPSYCGEKNEDEIPKNIQKDPVQLAVYLTADASSETDKAIAIYEWITSNIEYDVKQAEKPKLNKNQDASIVLKKKKAICFGYAELFSTMCKAVGVKCEVIPGYVRDEDFTTGKYLHIDYHCWNAFKADGKWYLCDPTWDSGHMGMDAPFITKWFYRVFKKKKMNDYPKNKYMFIQTSTKDHFMVSVDTFALRHLPTHPMWQLRTGILSINVFENGADSIRCYFSKEPERVQDYNQEIENYYSLSAEDKPVFLGEVGHSFNTRNTTIMLTEYARFLTILDDKEVQTEVKKSKIAKRDLAIFLNEKNDTVKKYLKLSEKNEKSAFKNNTKVDKDYFKDISNQHKALSKSLKTLNKQTKKNKSTLSKSTNKFNDLLKQFKKFDYSFQLKLDEQYHNIKDESDLNEIKKLRSKRDKLSEALNNEYPNKSLKELFKTTNYALEYTKYNLTIIEINNHLVDEVLNKVYFKEDSLLTVANFIASNEIVKEAFNKDFLDSCKALIREYKALSRDFKLKNNKSYNRLILEFENEMNEINRYMLIHSTNGKKYNRQYVSHLSQLENVLKSLEHIQKEQTKAEENRHKEIMKREEIRNKKASKLYKKIDQLLKESERYVKQNKKV